MNHDNTAQLITATDYAGFIEQASTTAPVAIAIATACQHVAYKAAAEGLDDDPVAVLWDLAHAMPELTPVKATLLGRMFVNHLLATGRVVTVEQVERSIHHLQVNLGVEGSLAITELVAPSVLSFMDNSSIHLWDASENLTIEEAMFTGQSLEVMVEAHRMTPEVMEALRIAATATGGRDELAVGIVRKAHKY